MRENSLNKFGVMLSDKFILNYYGTIVIFEVCGTEEEFVTVYEMRIKEIEVDGKKTVTLHHKFGPSKKPYVVPLNMNSYEKSDYSLRPSYVLGDLRLPIPVPLNSPLYLEAVRNGIDYPAYGIVYAEPLKEYLGVYWFKENEDTGTHFDA